MSGLEQAPLSSVITKFALVTSGTSMITRAPYPNGQYYRVRKIECSTLDDGVSGITWKFWDQDLSSTTAGTVGSAVHALILISPRQKDQSITASGIAWGGYGFAASGITSQTIIRDYHQTARRPFYAGVTVATNTESHITLELEIV